MPAGQTAPATGHLPPQKRQRRSVHSAAPHKSGGESTVTAARWMDRLSWELGNTFPSTAGTCHHKSHHRQGWRRVGALCLPLSPLFPSLGLHSAGLTTLHFPKPLCRERSLMQKEGTGPMPLAHGLEGACPFYTWPLTELQSRRKPRSGQPACLPRPLDGALDPLWELLHPSSK